MTQIRDNAGGQTAGVGTQPTNTDVADPQALHPTGLVPAVVVAERRHRIHLENDEKRQQAFQADFSKKVTDPPGYGNKETEDAKTVKKTFVGMGSEVPTVPVAQQVYAAAGQTKPFTEMVDSVKSALVNEGAVPTVAEFKAFGTETIAAAGIVSKDANLTTTVGATAGPETQVTVSTANATEPAADAAATSTPAATDPAADPSQAPTSNGVNKVPYTTNVTALVMLVILQAQQETTKEKGDVLRQMKMYNGMTDQVNKLVENNLIPAQKQLEDLKNKGKDKKGFDESKLQVPVNFPTSIDTDNAALNLDTGETVLNAQWGDAKGSSRQLVDASGLQNLISTADSWRTSINNNQQRQSNRFTAKDNQSSSGFNMLNAILKNAHDAVSAIVRNV